MKNGIGTDPTLVEVIDSLDVLPEKKKEEPNKNDKKPQKEKPSLIKQILFIVLILALMGGVAYGVYYYLTLARKKNNQNTTPTFVLNDVTVNVGDKLSSSLSEYGNFTNLDITNCKLNTSEVDTSKAGTYPYYVVCSTSKYTAKVIVVESENGGNTSSQNEFKIKNEFIYLTKGSEINPERLISSEEKYTYTFENKENVKSIVNDLGIQSINIKVTDTNNVEKTYTSFIYVIDSEPKIKFSCQSPDGKVVDKTLFDSNKENIDKSVRMNVYTYNNDTELNDMISKIEGGILSIDDDRGYALIDYSKRTITLVKMLQSDILDQEYGSSFPTSYNEISNYYRNKLKFDCTFD